ncbi:hypothetical protein MTR_2g050170 [Medicago truncatula]|uniref:Uncharacterized protein n=1 Tax=Medicago truncatula TaxID=3880 RepID=A0A072V7Z9_MEDTR|nr:hypothetical protein MTR_2g050170 [Medicago truncatula]
MASTSASDSASTCFRCFQMFEHTRSRFPLFIRKSLFSTTIPYLLLDRHEEFEG